jgi:benzil reductase ((S)-benzoin forming)
MKAIVSGHSKGLGAAIAAHLLAQDIAVLGLARQRNEALAQQYPALLKQAALDLGDNRALDAWLHTPALRDFLGEAHTVPHTVLLINNAGTVQPVGPLARQDSSRLAAAIALNVGAPLMLAAAFAAASEGAADRRIMHISSGAGRNAYAGWSVYCASKAALDQHARAVALDAALETPPSLRICSMAPGIVDTGMQAEIRASDESAFPMKAKFETLKRDGHLATPQATAAQLVEYLLSDRFGTAPVADVRQLN